MAAATPSTPRSGLRKTKIDTTWMVLPIAALATIYATVFLTTSPSVETQVVGAVAVAAVTAGLTFIAARGTSALASILFTAAVVLLPLNGLRSGGATASDAALVTAVILGLTHPDSVRRSPRLPQRFIVGMYIFVVAGLIGTATSGGSGVGNFARLLGTMLAAILGITLWRPSFDHVLKLTWAWLAGSAINVAVAVVTMRSLDPGRRPEGLTTHPNALGLTCAMSIGFAIFAHSASVVRGRRLALGFIAVSFVGVAVSGSRAAVLAAATILLIRAFVTTGPTARFTATTAAATAALVAGPLSARLPNSSALNRLLQTSGGGVTESNADRVGKFHDSIAAIESHPWTGIGFVQANYGHDLALQIAVSAGLMGLGGFIVACVPTISSLFVKGANQWRWLPLPALGFFAASLFTNNLWDRYVWFALGLGLLAYLNTRPTVTEQTMKNIRTPTVHANA